MIQYYHIIIFETITIFEYSCTYVEYNLQWFIIISVKYLFFSYFRHLNRILIANILIYYLICELVFFLEKYNILKLIRNTWKKYSEYRISNTLFEILPKFVLLYNI